MKNRSQTQQLSPSKGGRRSPGKNETENKHGGPDVFTDHSFRRGNAENTGNESNYGSKRSKQNESQDFEEKRRSPGKHDQRHVERLGAELEDNNFYRNEIDDLRSSIEKLRNKQERQRTSQPREYESALEEWERSQIKKKQAAKEMELTFSNTQSPTRPITHIGGPHLDTVEKEIIRKQQQKREEDMLRYLSKRAQEKEQELAQDERAIQATKSLSKSGSSKKNLGASFHALEEKINDLEKQLDSHHRPKGVESQAGSRGFSNSKTEKQASKKGRVAEDVRDYGDIRPTSATQARKKAVSTRKNTATSSARQKATSSEAFEIEIERLREENLQIKKELEDLKNQKQRGRFVPMNDDEYDVYLPDQEIHQENQVLRAHPTNQVVNNETLEQRLERAEKKYVSDPAISQVIKKARAYVQTELYQNPKKPQPKYIKTGKVVRQKENYFQATSNLKSQAFGQETQKNLGPKKYRPERTFLLHLGMATIKRAENFQY